MLFKDNNYYYYDSVGGLRSYFAWDLDTSQRGSVDVLSGGVPGGTTVFTDVLFSNWQEDYRAELERILTLVTPAAIADELSRAAAWAAKPSTPTPTSTAPARKPSSR